MNDSDNETISEGSDGEISVSASSQSESSIIGGSDEEMADNGSDGDVVEEDDSEGEGDTDEDDNADADVNARVHGGFEDVVFPELPPRSTREVFLITLSQAPPNISKEIFSSMIIDGFQASGEAVIEKWVCGKEPHKNGGSHFHMTVKLDRQKRWQRVKTYVNNTMAYRCTSRIRRRSEKKRVCMTAHTCTP